MKNFKSIFLIIVISGISFYSFSKNEEIENKAPTALVSAFSMSEKVVAEEQLVEKIELPSSAKTRIEKKEVLKKVKELKAEVEQIKNNSAAQKKGSDWDPKFKIGTILTTVAILLAIVGIGWVAGIAALVGLFFLVVGLLHTYN
ncbi:MAG: hypothetical protein RJA76_80 [Bacteroidota bacterium]|jgi:hypothetical protein